MDAYEATKVVFQRIQSLDPQNASKIMGLVLIQDHGEKEMIRLAFGPESLLHSVIRQARKELSLPSPNMPSTPPSPSPFSLSRQNSSSFSSSSSSRLLLPSPLSINISSSTAPSSWTNSSNFSDFHSTDDLMSPGEVDLIDELQLQDQLSFLDDGPKSSDFFYQDAAAHHRRSCSVSDICDDLSGGFGWKPCLFYARGYCKNGTTCRFVHGGDGGSPVMEQCQELLRSKSTQQQFPYNFLLQQQQLSPDSPRGLMMSDGMLHKFGRSSVVMNNPVSRQIYLTFPADSTFKEEDVSNYFSNYGPVQDVRIPYQQKRMFGFVTFDYPETVKLILAKGNPHFVCDARVLVKPYKEKAKIPDKHRKQQQQIERGEFVGCGSPTGLESRDPYDLHLGARMLYNTQDMLWRRKLEDQADLQHAIELQNRRLMGLKLLDVKRNSHHRTLSTGAVISSPTYSPTTFNNHNFVMSSNRSSPEDNEENGPIGNDKEVQQPNGKVMENNKGLSSEDENSNGKESSPKESNLHESSEHNLPDSPFASPKAAGDYATAFSKDNFTAEKGSSVISAPSTNNNLITGPSLFPTTSSLSCYFQVPRFASGHETIGM